MSCYNYQVLPSNLVQVVTILPCIWVVAVTNLYKGTEHTDRLLVVFLGSSKFQNNKLHWATNAYSHILVTVLFIIILPIDAK
jgi:hypothetical protein